MDLYERKHQEYYYVRPPSVVIQTQESFLGGPSFFFHIYPNKFILFHFKNLLPIQQTKLQDLEP